MAAASLIWDLIARDGASPTFARVAASADKAAASTDRAAASTAGFGKKAVAALGALATVDFGVHAVKDAVEFQKAMTLIQTQAGASAAKVKVLSSAVLGMAGETGTAPLKLADSLYHIVSAGQGILSTAQELDTLKIAAEGAKVGNSDLTETTNALTASVTSGIKGVQNISSAMGALNAIVGGGDMKLEDLNEALASGVLVTAKQFGLSLTDVGAALDVFGDNNIRGANAATALKQSVQALAKPVIGGASALDKIGVSSHQLAVDMQQGGLNKALVDLKSHLTAAGITGSKTGVVLLDAFGKKAGVGISILEDQLTRFQIKQDEIKKGADGFGLAWKATQGTASFALSSIAAEAQAATTAIGNKLLPDVTVVAHWLGTELPAAAHIAARVVDPLWDMFVTGAHAAATVLGPIGKALGSVKGPLSDIAAVALTTWAAFKGAEIATVLFQNIAIYAKGAALNVLDFGVASKAAALNFVSSGTAISASADTTATSVIASGDAARIGWAGIAGPLVAVGVGIGVLVSLFHKSSAASKEAASAAKTYTDALSSGGKSDLVDAITKQLSGNKVPQTIAALNKDLKQTAISGTQFVTAIQSGGQPLDSLRDKLQGIIKTGTQVTVTTGRGASAIATLSPAARAATKLLSDLNAQFSGLSKATKTDLADTKAFAGVSSSIDKVAQSTIVGTSTAQQYAQMLGIVVDKNGVAAVSAKTLQSAVTTVSNAYAGATQTGSEYLAALNTFSSSAGTAADRAALIGATLKAANGDALNYASQINAAAVATSQLDADVKTASGADAAAAKAKKDHTNATAAVTAANRAYLKSVINLKTGTIDYSKAAAAPLINDMQSIQTAAMNAAEAQYQHSKATESGAKAADDAYATYKKYTQSQLVDQFTKLGLNTRQAQKLANQYLGMPKQVKTQIEAAGTDPVLTVLNKIGALLAKLTGQPWTTEIVVDGVGFGVIQKLRDQLASLPKSVGVSVNAVGQIGVKGGGRYAAGGSVADGYFTVGEQGYELGYKQGSKVQIFSNAQSRAMTGMSSVPGYATGTKAKPTYTVAGTKYTTKVSAENAQTRADKATAKAAATLLAAANKLATSYSDLKDYAAALLAAAKSQGDSSKALKGLSTLQSRLLSDAKARDHVESLITNDAGTGAKDVLGKMTDYRSGVASTLTGQFDPTQFGSISDFLTGIGSATSTNNAYNSESKILAARFKGNKAGMALLNTLEASGQTATLQSLASGSKAQDLQAAKAYGGYTASVGAGSNTATTNEYGKSVAQQQATVNELVEYQKSMVTALGELATAFGQAATKDLTLDGKTFAHMTDKQIEAAVRKLVTAASHGRSKATKKK